ncbi:hypothetical protein D3C79_688970 [compost metagenome]
MGGVDVGVDEADRNTLVAGGNDPLAQGIDFFQVQRPQDTAVGGDALVEHEALVARHQRCRQRGVEVVLFETAFGAHFDHIPKTLGGDERSARTTALDQRVGRQRRAVNHRIDLAQYDTGLAGHFTDPLDDGRLGEGVVRKHFGGMQGLPHLHRHIGKGPTDVHANPDWLSVSCHYQLPTTRFYTLA